jgi:hypothetical protein
MEHSPKTTNCTEGWHNSLRSVSVISSQHLVLLDGLKKDMAIQHFTILKQDAAHGEQPQAKYHSLAVCLANKVSSYHDEEDKMKYLRAISFLTAGLPL